MIARTSVKAENRSRSSTDHYEMPKRNSIIHKIDSKLAKHYILRELGFACTDSRLPRYTSSFEFGNYTEIGGKTKKRNAHATDKVSVGVFSQENNNDFIWATSRVEKSPKSN